MFPDGLESFQMVQKDSRLPGKFPNCVEANKPIIHLGPKNSEVRRLLGDDYKYSAEIDQIEVIYEILVDLYKRWELSSEDLSFNRPDLYNYLSEEYLIEQMSLILKSRQ